MCGGGRSGAGTQLCLFIPHMKTRKLNCSLRSAPSLIFDYLFTEGGRKDIESAERGCDFWNNKQK